MKTELSARRLSEREALPYLVVYVAMWAAVTGLPSSSFNVWDALSIAWSVLLAVFGTIYIYRRNGGADGRNLLQRYFAIGWVVTVRWFVVILAAAIAYYFAVEALGLWTEVTSWNDLLFFGAVELILYWRIGQHVGDVAGRTNTPSPV